MTVIIAAKWEITDILACRNVRICFVVFNDFILFFKSGKMANSVEHRSVFDLCPNDEVLSGLVKVKSALQTPCNQPEIPAGSYDLDLCYFAHSGLVT